MESLIEQTGLSQYNLDLLYDFYPHKFANNNQKMTHPTVILSNITCPNPNIFIFNQNLMNLKTMPDDKTPQQQQQQQQNPSSSTTKGVPKKKNNASLQKQIISKRESELDKQVKQGLITSETKDMTMVYEFLGWAHTSTNHFVYVYCISPSADKSKPENWRMLDKQLLAMFHRRLGKDVSSYYRHSSSDITESRDKKQHLAVDMRYIINRWMSSSEGERIMPLIKQNGHLFIRGVDYILMQHKEKEKTIATLSREKQENTMKKKEIHKHEKLIEEGCDPYEVKDDELCYITGEEYANLREIPIGPQIRSNFNNFVTISRNAYLDKTREPSSYEHDPGLLFDQLCIATNMSSQAKRSISQITRDNLMIVKNNNTASLIDQLGQEACNDIKERVEEFMWANMSVEHASRSITPIIKAKLNQ